VNITVVVGNPNPRSRTRQIAEAVADAVAAIVGETTRTVIDLIDVAEMLFDSTNQTVAALNETVAQSDFVIIATPTYKAAYTGLLKAFLDRYDTNGLANVVAIPVMTGGSPAHALAPDTTLRPLLVELGASVPTRSLYFLTAQMQQLPEIVQGWADVNRAALLGAAQARRVARG
jgi:FMN reductase